MSLERDVILTATDVAKWLKVSPRQVLRLTIPRIELGFRTVRFREQDVQAWLRASLGVSSGRPRRKREKPAEGKAA